MTARRKFLSLLMATTVLALGGAATASASDTVRVRDACDPASFNAVLGDGACVRDSSGSRVEFGSFVDRLIESGSHPKWAFDRDRVRLDSGEALKVRFDRGGEGHTFTEVPQYGPGCVPDINMLIGADGPPVVDCTDDVFGATFIGPDRTSFEIDDLSRGTHRFMCLIHPWMRTTVSVR